MRPGLTAQVQTFCSLRLSRSESRQAGHSAVLQSHYRFSLAVFSVLLMKLMICGAGSEGRCAKGLDLVSATQSGAKRAAQCKGLIIEEDKVRSCDDTKHVPFAWLIYALVACY